MNKWLLGLAAGLMLLTVLPALPPLWLCISAAAVLLVLALRWRRLLPLAALALGLCWSVWQAGQALAARVPHEWEGQNLWVKGRVVDLPVSSMPAGVRFRFQPTCVRSKTMPACQAADGLWQLSSREALPVRPGEVWSLAVRVKRPHGSVSPGSFDSEGWLLEEGVSASGYVVQGHREAAGSWSMDEFRLRVRERFQDEFSRTRVVAVPAHASADDDEPAAPAVHIEHVVEPEAGVQLALLTGDRALVPQDSWALYSRTGITHLMAISGPHITLAGLVVAFFLRRLLGRFPRIALRFPIPELCLLAGFLVSIAYSFLAGLGIPTERTLLMLAVGVWAVWRRRELPAFAVLLRALVLVLLAQPLAVQAAGFWLSFGAVALLMLLAWSIPGEAVWREFGRTQMIVTLGLLPLTVAIFARVSLVAPLTNLVAIPLVTFVVVPLGMLGLLADSVWHAAGVFFWHLGIWTLQGLDWGLAQMAAWSWAAVSWSLPPLAMLSLVLAITCLLLPRGLPGRWLALFFLLPVIWARQPMPEGSWRFALLDVGQGLSVVVQTRNHILIYDTGPAFGPGADAGGRVVLPYLHWAGARQVDTLVLSHDDLDHTGGARSVIEGIPVTRELGAWPASVSSLSTPHEPCAAGQDWTWDGVHFEVLFPWPGLELKGDNNQSCVLRVEGAGHTLLLPGDLEKPGEMQLVEQDAGYLHADVLVLGHHGSATSSSPAFLTEVSPQVALVSAGYRNRFHHPSAKVIDRVESMHLPWLSTVDSGALIYDFRSGQPGLPVPLAWRRAAGHYWLTQP